MIGLPPTPDEVEAFVRQAPNAFEKVVDIRSTGRSTARSGSSLAGSRALPRPTAERDSRGIWWKYRDYVIRAFNEDKPYDRFVKEQSPVMNCRQGRRLHHGHRLYRLGVWDDEPADRPLARYDYLTTFCARRAGRSSA